MNDEFFRKMTNAASELNKIKKIAGLDSYMNSSTYKTIEQSKALMGNINSDLTSNISLDSKVFNTIMSSILDVSKIINKDFDNDKIKNFINPNFDYFIQHYKSNNIDKLESITSLTAEIYKKLNFDNYNWKDEYKDIFSSKFNHFENYKGYTKFNDNINKLINSSILSTTSTIADGAIVSMSLDNNQIENIDPEIEKIYQITNEAFEKLTDISDYSLAVINKLLAKLSKFVNHPYTVGLVTGIALIIANYYFTKITASDSENNPTYRVERIISEKTIPIKHKAIKAYKAFENIPIGAEISIIEKYRLWAKVTFINSKGIPQIGYCRIEDLSE